MYQTPVQQGGVYTPPVSNPQGQGSTGQTTMYQMPPDPSQPVFTGSQPTLGPQAQYYVPTGQPVQPVQGQGAPVQPTVNQNENARRSIKIDTAYLKTSLGGSRFLEFVLLLIAWPCTVVYSNRTLGLDGRTNFFEGVAIFCWVMVIVLHAVFMFGINEDKRYFGRPSNCTLISLGVQVLMTILLVACSTSLTVRAVDVQKASRDSYGRSKPFTTNMFLLFAAVPFGGLACLAFLDDIRLLSKLYRKQRAEEIAAAGIAQQPGLQ